MNDINVPNLNHIISDVTNTTASGQLSAVDDNKVTSAVITVADSKSEPISNNTPGGLVLDVPLHIGEIFKRPVQYYVVPLSTLTTSNLNTDPARGFLTDPAIQAKCRNFNLIRGDFHVRASVLSSAYAYGRIILSIMTPQNTAMSTPPPAAKTYIQAKGRDHVVLDIGMAATAEIKIPWTNCVNYWTTIPTDYSTSIDIPALDICLETPLLDVSTGAVPAGNLTLFVWMDNVELGIPTPFNYTSEVTKATAQGFLSAPLSTISKATHMMSNVPVIGKFSEAISLATGAGSRIAALFGFSKPQDLSPMTNVGGIALSTSIGLDQFKPHTLDPQQQVTLNPELSASKTDVLAFKNIIGRFGPVAYADYGTGTTAGSTIMTIPVHPGLVLGATNSDTAVMMTPLCFGAITHSFWRGTLRYRFNFVASKYHRGRVRIFWSPTNNNAIPVNNTSFNTIVDLASSTTVDLEMTWMHQLPYLETGLCTAIGNVITNGYIIVQALVPLISPSTACPIHVAVDCAAGDDFELIRPTFQYIQKFSIYPFNAPTVDYATILNPVNFAAGITDGTRIFSGISPGPSPIIYQSSLTTTDTNVAVHSNVSTAFGSSVYQKVNQTYMGEQFNSFRAACKRFTTGFTFGGTSTVAFNPVRFIPWAPPFPGTISNGSGGYFRAPTSWTFPSWFVLPFRGARGSMRVNVVTDSVSTYTTTSKSRTFFAYERKYSRSLIASPQITASSLATTVTLANQMAAGSEYFDAPVGQAISFSIPYQHVGNYHQTPWPGQAISASYEPGIDLLQWGNSPSPVEILYAAGEDWTPVAWVQVPYMYLVMSNPSGTTVTFADDPSLDIPPGGEDELPSPVSLSASGVTGERLLLSNKRYSTSFY